MYAGLAGHHVEDSLKVLEYDDDGLTGTLHSSTLDEFGQVFHVWTDFGLFLFTLTTAGVKIKRISAITMLIFVSQWLGKFVGIVLMYEVAYSLCCYPPLGVRRKHILLVGLICGVGLTVSLFMADVAFHDPQLHNDAKLGAVISPLIAAAGWLLSRFYDFSHEDVAKEEQLQLEDEVRMSESAHRPPSDQRTPDQPVGSPTAAHPTS
jgi:flagellar biosynthesis protein FliQ